MRESLLSALVLTALVAAGSPAAAQDAEIIELTQTACQFLEPEHGVDHRYETSRKADCEAVNDASGDERLADAQVLELKPGKYIFRVTNRDVPYDLGFWLRGASLLRRATLPSVSGGGLEPGATKDYAVELREGEYVYSCPLNPTPDYRIVVGG